MGLGIVEDGFRAGGFLGVVVGIEGHESIEAVAEDGLGGGIEVGTVADGIELEDFKSVVGLLHVHAAGMAAAGNGLEGVAGLVVVLHMEIAPDPDVFGILIFGAGNQAIRDAILAGRIVGAEFSQISADGGHRVIFLLLGLIGADAAVRHLATVPEAVEHNDQKKAVIVTDLLPEDMELKAMIDRFVAVFPYGCDVINIQDFPFQGGCLSCFGCAATGKCVYKDGFDEFLRGTIHKHDAILYAFRIKDHSMGGRFKIYDDRQFCNGHRTVTMGTPFGYLVVGDYSVEENLRLLLEARAQVGGNFLAGVATDEGDVDKDIDTLAATVAYAIEKQYSPPQNFLGVGGMKIFRDLIYMMRGLMRADHKFFKSHGQYDFPQKKWRTSWMMYLVGAMMNNPRLKRKMGGKMSEGMIGPYKRILDL